MGLFSAVKRQAKVLAGTIVANVGQSAQSPALLDRARSIDHRNFRAVRSKLSLAGRDCTGVDRILAATNLIADCPPAAETVILNLLSHSQSQICQDIFCVLAHHEKRNGFFVEVGVGTGTSISNTYLLEKNFGWTGLLVEPCRSFHDSISRDRSAKLDTRAASSRDSGEIQFHEAIGDGEFSFSDNAKTSLEKAQVKMATTSYAVPTTTLNRIFAEQAVPGKIDFLSLDTEGSELDILRGLDLSKYQIGAMCIEHNNRQGFVEELDKMLLPQGFARVLPLSSRYDAWYISNALSARLVR
jgi:FkbM family methyltransferase